MEYSKIGNTDIEVSKLCVGCMNLLYREDELSFNSRECGHF